MKKLYILFLIIIISFIVTSNILKAASYVNEQFVPYIGYSTINQDGMGRYSIQYMYWRSTSLGAFDSWNDTYEHETVFYNYDGSAYASRATSWQTNLPDPYLDTQALDGNKEYNITVGTFDPDTLQTYQWYNSFVRLNSTSSNQSYYKISGQKGYSLCESNSWCVENEQTAILMPFKSPFKAPESRGFLYEWESNNSRNLADSISLGGWGTGVMGSTSDNDYYVFNVPTARTVNFILKVSHISGADYDITIYDKNGNYVISSAKGSGQDEVFSKSLAAGNYYARIYSYSGFDTVKTYNFIPY